MTRSRRGYRRPRALALVLLLLTGFAPRPAPPVAAQSAGVATLAGSLSLDLAADPAGYLGLVDLTGFVRRDVAYLQGPDINLGWIDHATGAFQLDLPIAPTAPLNDVGHAGAGGVQLFSLAWLYDFAGDARIGPWDAEGWPWADSSLLTTHGTHEVTGGKIVVWAPDGNQRFPTDFGADGRLFTADDPVAPLAAGWTVMDLDERPFAPLRDARVSVPINLDQLQPDDLSQLPATEAFDKLVEILRARDPFADAIPIDWDALRATYRPEFEAAEQSGERVDFWLALNHFLNALHDWQYFAIWPGVDVFWPHMLGATGLHVDVTDDGKVIVVTTVPGQAADRAGIRPGAEIVTWNGEPALEAVNDMPEFHTDSSAQAVLRQKIGAFGRAPAGTTIAVTFQNPGGAQTSVALQAVEIPGETLPMAVDCYRPHTACDPTENPISVERLPSGIAVIHVRYFGDPIYPITYVRQTWDATLSAVAQSDATGLVLDLRGAQGSVGIPPSWPAAYIAGSFFDQPFQLADVTSVDANGQNLTVAEVTIRPSPVQWTRPLAVLVDEGTKGIGELLVLALSHRPGVIIAGMSATGGSLSGQMEPVLLPTGNFVTVVDQAYRDPVTHEVLVEGTGIAPTLRVPKTVETVLSAMIGDPVRDAAEHALLTGGSAPPGATPQS